MKLSAQEEYGLRCLLHLARCADGESRTIPEISRAEGLSAPNVAKLMRLLRLGGLVQSARGQSGGYTLSRPASQITVAEVLYLLGGPLFGPAFCERHTGKAKVCPHARDCSLRSLWSSAQSLLGEILRRTSLADLLCDERAMARRIEELSRAMLPMASGIGQPASLGNRV